MKIIILAKILPVLPKKLIFFDVDMRHVRQQKKKIRNRYAQGNSSCVSDEGTHDAKARE